MENSNAEMEGEYESDKSKQDDADRIVEEYEDTTEQVLEKKPKAEENVQIAEQGLNRDTDEMIL